MDLRRKIELAEQAIRSISTHDDVDLAVRTAALNRLILTIKDERAQAADRVKARAEELVAAGGADDAEDAP